MRHFPKTGAISLAVLFSFVCPLRAQATKITIMHTNDLHSHFQPEKNEQNLGGIARMATLVQQIRRDYPGAMLVDGGDWSEGQIYYYLNTGLCTLNLMDQIHYDVSLPGNHDWLNGPGVLLDAIMHRLNPTMQLVAANVDVSKYDRKDDWSKWIQPYTVISSNGIKIAYVGILTYEHIYDSYLEPVRLVKPEKVVEDLAKKLKSSGTADLVIAISHNSIATNKKILEKSPHLDFVIGAHDHVKLLKPEWVRNRKNAPDGFVVETGAWGRFLGLLQLNVDRDPKDPKKISGWNLDRYELREISPEIREDGDIAKEVEGLETLIEKQFGKNIFHDEVATTSAHLVRSGIESPMLNFTTDAYLHAVPSADFAWDQYNFVYGALLDGPLRTVDFINANPAIYNPVTGKAWTLHTIKMKGKTIEHIIRWEFFTKSLANQALFSGSGISFIYDPGFKSFFNSIGPKRTVSTGADDEEDASPSFGIFPSFSAMRAIQSQGPLSDIGIIRQIMINGQPLKPDQVYTVVTSGGILQSIDFTNQILPKLFSFVGQLLPDLGRVDTGIESWEAIKNYASDLKQITRETARVTGRIRSYQPDLGVNLDDIEWMPQIDFGVSHTAYVKVTVYNFGMQPSSPDSELWLLSNLNGADQSKEPREILLHKFALGSIASGDKIVLEARVSNIAGSRGLYPIIAQIKNSRNEVNTTNDRAERYFQYDPNTFWHNYLK